jgi:hypothetical protein
MFLVNSHRDLFTAATFSSKREVIHLLVALLLPKLRSQFAEFLNMSSPEHLRILSSPTCGGLRYGLQNNYHRGFSWQHGYDQLSPKTYSAYDPQR